MMTERPRESVPGRASHVLALLVYGTFVLILFFPILSRPTTAFIGGEPGPAAQDPLSFMWFLEWFPYAFSHHLDPFLTNWLLSYSGVNLAWNTAVPFVSVVMAPITLLLGPIFSYNLAILLSVIASAWAAYYAVSRVFKCGFLPALLAGTIYGFSPFETAHAIGHLHMTPAFGPPLFLLVLYDVLVMQRSPSWLNGAKLAGLTVIQFFVSAEVLLMVACVAAMAVVGLVLSCRRALSAERVRYGLASIAYAMLMAGPLLAYPLYLMWYGPWQPAHPIHNSSDLWVADVLSFFVPTSTQAIFGRYFLTANSTGGEWNTYLGLPLIGLLVAIAWVKRGDPIFRFLMGLTAAVTVCSLGPSLHIAGSVLTGIPLPWRLFDFIAVFRDVQTNRFGQFLFLLVAPAIALFLADRSVSHKRRLARAGVSLMCLSLLFPRIPLYPTTRVDVPPFFTRHDGAGAVESPVLVVPGDARAMLWQAEARMAFKMPEGYVYGAGRPPWPSRTPLFDALVRIEHADSVPELSRTFRIRAGHALRRQRIKTIVLGPSPHEREALAFLVDFLGRPTDHAGGVYVWRGIDKTVSDMPP